jgi:peptide/nickel transport system permease protein
MIVTPTAAVSAGGRRLRVGLALAWIFVALTVVAALFPQLLTAQQPDAVDPGAALAGPGGGHLFGTDELGRDVFTRIAYGARFSLGIGIGSTVLALIVGTLLGVLAATAGRVVDDVITWLTNVFLAFPGLLLAMLVVAVLGPGTLNVIVAIGLSSAPGFARLARGQAMIVRNSGYVRAAITLGHRRPVIYLRHLLPNALPPLLLFATLYLGAAIVSGSALSFLGLGPQPPTPEWGAMLADGQNFLGVAWQLAVFPGLVVTLAVVSFTVVGRDLRRRFEGRLPDVRV